MGLKAGLLKLNILVQQIIQIPNNIIRYLQVIEVLKFKYSNSDQFKSSQHSLFWSQMALKNLVTMSRQSQLAQTS